MTQKELGLVIFERDGFRFYVHEDKGILESIRTTHQLDARRMLPIQRTDAKAWIYGVAI